MEPTPTFLDAYDTLAAIPGQAQKALESVQGRTIDENEAVATSPMGEVQVTVAASKVRSIWIDENWLGSTRADVIADLIRDTVNSAWAEWTRVCMTGLEAATPEMSEVTATIEAARTQLRQAFDAEMARISKAVTS